MGQLATWLRLPDPAQEVFGATPLAYDMRCLLGYHRNGQVTEYRYSDATPVEMPRATARRKPPRGRA